MRVRMLSRLGRWAAAVLVPIGVGGMSLARADALGSDITYSTTAEFSGVGLPIIYEGVKDAKFTGSGALDLGQFKVIPPSTGGDVVFRNAEFRVAFDAPQFDKVVDDPNVPAGITTQYEGAFTVVGHLNGTVKADGSSDLVASIDGVQGTGIDVRTTDRVYVNGLPFSTADVKLPTNLDLTSGAGGTQPVSLAAQVGDPTVSDVATAFHATGVTATVAMAEAATGVQPVPEPSSLAVFGLVVLGGFVASRRSGKGRAAA